MILDFGVVGVGRPAVVELVKWNLPLSYAQKLCNYATRRSIVKDLDAFGTRLEHLASKWSICTFLVHIQNFGIGIVTPSGHSNVKILITFSWHELGPHRVMYRLVQRSEPAGHM